MLIMLKKKNLFNAPLMVLCYQTVLTLLPSSKTSRLQNKEECEIFLVKMSFIISLKMKKKNIFHINGFSLTFALKQRLEELMIDL